MEEAAAMLEGEELVMEDGHYEVLCRRRVAVVQELFNAGAPEGVVMIHHGDGSNLGGDGHPVSQHNREERSK